MTARPHSAIRLAAGLPQRMRPLTWHTAKPLHTLDGGRVPPPPTT
jgi:CTP:phosphocholine cytidylyltransferase-like protein